MDECTFRFICTIWSSSYGGFLEMGVRLWPNLSPDAAIIVPGMSYQPPLIGFKQLLNFGAYSIPDVGGWIFIAAGLALLSCVVLTSLKTKKK